MEVNTEEKCRLCSDINTVDVCADVKDSDYLIKFIHLASGVKIDKSDRISTKVCYRCCRIAVKLMQYRKYVSLNNNLIENETKLDTIKGDEVNLVFKNLAEDLNVVTEKQKEQILKPCSPPKNRMISRMNHFSANKLLEEYPNLKLPLHIMSCHIQPEVWLEIMDVEAEMKKLVKNTETASENNVMLKLNNVTIKKVGAICEGVKSDDRVPDQEKPFANLISNLKLRLGQTKEVSEAGTSSCSVVEVLSSNGSTSDGSVTNTLPVIPPLNNADAYKQRSKRTKRKLVRLVEETDSEEIMPKKKIRSLKNGTTELQKAELTSDNMSNKNTFVSSLELTPAFAKPTGNQSAITEKATDKQLNIAKPFVPASPGNKNLLSPSGKADAIFICTVCNTVWDSKKELFKHQIVHYMCKFCNDKFKTLFGMHKHISKKHLGDVLKHPPRLQLHKIDRVKEVVEKYPEAFEKVLDDVTIIQPEIEVICLDDDDDEGESETIKIEVASSGVQKHTVESVPTVCPTINGLKTQDIPNLLFRDKVMDSLFKKHAKLEKKDNATQAFAMDQREIEQDSNLNLLIFKGLCADLTNQKIPITFKLSPKMTAAYTCPLPKIQQRTKLNWSRVKSKQLQLPDVRENTHQNKGGTSENNRSFASGLMTCMQSNLTQLPNFGIASNPQFVANPVHTYSVSNVGMNINSYNTMQNNIILSVPPSNTGVMSNYQPRSLLNPPTIPRHQNGMTGGNIVSTYGQSQAFNGQNAGSKTFWPPVTNYGFQPRNPNPTSRPSVIRHQTQLPSYSQATGVLNEVLPANGKSQHMTPSRNNFQQGWNALNPTKGLLRVKNLSELTEQPKK